MQSNPPNVIWKPLPGSQSLALSCPCNHILFEGSRGPGKTDAQIMKYRRYVGQGYGQYWRGVIFEKTYKALDDVISKANKWFPKFNDGAKFLRANSALKWVWPTGEELLFRVLEKESEYDKYHGHEYPFIGWNELTKWPTSACYDKMMSCNRSSFLPEEHTPKGKDGKFNTPDGKLLPEIPLMVFSTTNPHGVGHNWVKRRFINPAEPGNVKRISTKVFNPRTQQEETIVKTQVRLFGSYKENKYLSPEYIAELVNDPDPNRREAWLNGNWDITAGGAFDDLWKRSVHVIPRFPIPKEWSLTRSLDWGSTHPYSVGWWAKSNGEEVKMPNGKKRCFPKGTLIRFAENYGAKLVNGEQFGHNQGRKLGARKLAIEIKEGEKNLKLMGWVDEKAKIKPGPADNQISDVNEDESDSIEKLMAEKPAQITWTKSDKKAGSRKNGFELFRNALERSLDGEGPGLYVMEHCKAFIETVPGLPRDEDDPDDVDTNAEDHVYDETRYMILDDKPVFAKKLSVGFAS
jgi:hypothetical protein